MLLDKARQPLSVYKSGQAARNVIMRCGQPAQAQRLACRGRVVRGAGGYLSPELYVPKLMWLNETYGAVWMERVGLALEIVDFLTLKCTSALQRSMNSLSCKFLYQPPPAGPGWDVCFYRAIGLETLLALELVHSIRAMRSGRACLPRPPASWAWCPGRRWPRR